MHRIGLTAEDVARTAAILSELRERFAAVESEDFARQCRVFAEELPRSLRAGLHEFAANETAAICVVSGFPVDDARIGATPDRFGGQTDPSSTFDPDAFFFLCGSLLGDPIGWETQQDGRMMHDSIAVRSGGRVHAPARTLKVAWHTEDAVHPYRADYVGFLCLRDHEGTAMTGACVGDVDLDPDDVDVLLQPRFPMSVGDPHLSMAAGHEPDIERVSLLFGSREQPYLRIDPYFVLDMPDDPVAEAAFLRLVDALQAAVVPIPLRPGECLFFDNYRAVHGRQAFRPRFDGTDRWLKGLNIVRDLRKSRTARAGATARTILGLPRDAMAREVVVR